MSKNKVILSAIVQGIYKSYTMTLYDKNKSPIDLTNKTVYFTIKKDIDDSDSEALFQKIIHITTPNPINVLALNLTTLETLDLEVGTFPFDIKISFVGLPKEIQFGFIGQISIEQSVTKDALR